MRGLNIEQALWKYKHNGNANLSCNFKYGKRDNNFIYSLIVEKVWRNEKIDFSIENLLLIGNADSLCDSEMNFWRILGIVVLIEIVTI